jgi:hypothetical protein
MGRDLCVMESRSAVSNTMSLLAVTENIPIHWVGSCKHLKRGNTNLVDEVVITMRGFMTMRDNCKLREDKNNITAIINYWGTR